MDFTLDPNASEPPIRAGMVAVIGKTNVGKSTLLNRLLDEKVSIVSPVVQTTRNVIRAVLTEERGQLVFLDTPGIHKAVNDLGKTMNKAARQTLEGVDVAVLVLDASASPEEEDEGCMRRLMFSSANLLIVLNKQDLDPKNGRDYKALWKRLQEEKHVEREAVWMKISAQDGRGLDRVLDYLFDHVPLGPMLFPEDVLTDFPKKLIMADAIREKFFRELHDEIPHQLAVGIDRIDEQKGGWAVQASVYVHRPSQKGIVIGKNGRLLKRVQNQAEKELSELYDRPVHLEKLWVKVEKNWMGNHFLLQQLGYRE